MFYHFHIQLIYPLSSIAILVIFNHLKKFECEQHLYFVIQNIMMMIWEFVFGLSWIQYIWWPAMVVPENDPNDEIISINAKNPHQIKELKVKRISSVCRSIMVIVMGISFIVIGFIYDDLNQSELMLLLNNYITGLIIFCSWFLTYPRHSNLTLNEVNIQNELQNNSGITPKSA